MKWLLPLSLCTLAAVVADGVPATRFLSHTMGESFSEWLAVSKIDLDQLCASGSPNGKVRRNERDAVFAAWRECQQLSGIKSTGAGEYGKGLDSEAYRVWTFRGGRLVKLVIYKPDTENDIALLTERYGAPASSGLSIYQNGFGAKFDCAHVAWKMPDGTVIHAEQSMEELTRFITITFASKEMAQEMESQTKKTNPY